jgi:hypothetical protein
MSHIYTSDALSLGFLATNRINHHGYDLSMSDLRLLSLAERVATEQEGPRVAGADHILHLTADVLDEDLITGEDGTELLVASSVISAYSIDNGPPIVNVFNYKHGVYLCALYNVLVSLFNGVGSGRPHNERILLVIDNETDFYDLEAALDENVAVQMIDGLLASNEVMLDIVNATCVAVPELDVCRRTMKATKETLRKANGATCTWASRNTPQCRNTGDETK